MEKKIIKTIFVVLGFTAGYFLAKGVLETSIISSITFFNILVNRILLKLACMLLFGLIVYIFSPKIYKSIIKLFKYVEKKFSKLGISEIFYGIVGAIMSLIIALIITLPLVAIYKEYGALLSFLINVIFACMGAYIMIKRKNDIDLILSNIKGDSIKKGSKIATESIPKILDTSVIIDGRIFDICQTGFMEGTLIIPNFVLDELRHISDSSDSLKRVRGRQGLDILNKIQKELDVKVEVWQGDFPEIREVDSKLLKLAEKLDGKVITNDYNLNKVAEVQGVPVLNINDLSNAVKPVVIPGEEMIVEIVKDGKESNQGVAYLDDGTMIVIEDGKKYIGRQIEVIVTSVLQTSAGRMIFGKTGDEIKNVI